MTQTGLIPQPDPDGAELLDTIFAFIRRFVVVGVHETNALALWVVHTHALDAASATPYPYVSSPLPRCGKTRLFDVLAVLVARPLLSANATTAAIFRSIESRQPTLLLDEIDAQFEKDRENAGALRSVLNAGYRKGAVVMRCAPRTLEVEEFQVFGAKAFAGVESKVLHSTTFDRCIPIRLERKTDADEVSRWKPRQTSAESEELRARIDLWAQTHSEMLITAEPSVPDELNDRAEEVWEPLFAIADAAGGYWPEAARSAAIALCTEGDPDEGAIGVRLLADIRALFEKASPTAALPTKTICSELHSLEDAPWANWGGRRREPELNGRDLAKQLSRFRIKPRTIRIGHGTDPDATAKGYKREQFEDAWDRYLSDSS